MGITFVRVAFPKKKKKARSISVILQILKYYVVLVLGGGCL
jgi:hypothetical protein